MTSVAVIDVGKTNLKVSLVDTARLEEVEVRTMPNVVRAGPLYPHYDTEAHWAFILDCLRELARAHGVGAVSVTTHGATAALVDAGGGLVLPVLDYEHDGPDALAERYDALRPSFEETGSPRLAAGLNLGAQLFWQTQTFPEAPSAAHVLMYPQYWAFRLCGVPASEATSLGCHTDLWAPHSGTFSSLVERQDWAALFPPLRQASDVLGPLLPGVAAETGLPPTTPVLCGLHDSNASLYPHLLWREEAFSVVSTGTWVICMAVRGAEVALDPRRDVLVNVNALGEPVPSARFMGGREFDTVRGGAEVVPSDRDRRQVLDRRVMLLPAVEPTSGPFPGRRSAWTAEPEGDGQRLVALSWYLALMTGTCLSMTGAEGPVLVEGPFARNADFVAMLRAAVGRPVEAGSGNVTGTSIGAALLSEPNRRRRPEPPDGGARTNEELKAYAEAWRRAVSQGSEG